MGGVSVHGGNHVAGALCAAAWHILGGGDEAGNVNARLEIADCPHRGNDRCAAGHVSLHGLHVGSRFERDAAGVERDALAHQTQIVIRVFRVAPIG